MLNVGKWDALSHILLQTWLLGTGDKEWVRGAAGHCSLACLLHRFWRISASVVPRAIPLSLSVPVSRIFHRYLQP